MSKPDVTAGLLPAIRCSDCGLEIELSRMTEHVCRRTSEPTLQLTQRTPAQAPSKSTLQSSSGSSFPIKPSRAPPPPRIQTEAIGRPLVPPNELTPASSGRGSHTFSPRSISSARSPFRAPSRGMTMPSRARPPSPELSNLDCAFPPFPTMPSRSTTPVSDSKSQNSDKESVYVRTHAEPYNAPSNAPSSRRGSTSSSGPRKRSNTLGNNHEANRRPSTAGGERAPSLANNSGGLRVAIPNVPPLPSPLFNVASRQSGSSILIKGQSPAVADQPVSDASKDDKGSDELPPHISEPGVSNTISLGNVTNESAKLANHLLDKSVTEPSHVQQGRHDEIELRAHDAKNPSETSKTEQDPHDSRPGTNGPSYRAKRPPSLSSGWPKDRAAGTMSLWERPQLSPNRSQTFPPPNGDQPTDDGRINTIQRRPSEPEQPLQFWKPSSAARRPMEAIAAPLEITTIMQAGTRPNHSPSDSASSYGSVNSVVPSRSSQSSQPSQGIESLKGLSFFPLPSELEQPEDEAETLPPPKAPAEQGQADSPTDPAFQGGRLTPIPGLQRTQTTPETPVQTSPQQSNNSKQDLTRPPLHRSKTTGAPKGQCRGCSMTIAANQKSVSSADGRLTGRYHKDCFACTTCHSAFATADFYVLKDQPYCAQHYHALNGTLCGSCGRGIEGQYLEATRSKARGPEKFHAKCFTCVMCRVVLQHDYFEHHGRFFCEKDITRVATPPNRSPNVNAGNRAGPGGNGFLSASNGNPRSKIPERRSTKLMIMS